MNEADRLAAIIDEFQRSMWLPDPAIVYIVLGAVAANQMGSPPVWLLVVGAPSSGKTEILDALSGLPEYVPISTFTEAGLLSGSSTREGAAATGGILRQVGERGLLVASDFGTLLNEHSSTRSRLFGCLREVYDGKFVRRLGTDGGRTFAWSGHAGFIGACTGGIDAPSIDLGTLGERFTYVRVPAATPEDEFMSCVVADEHVGHLGEVRARRAELVATFFADLSLPEEFPPLDEHDQERLITLAHLGARCRSSVLRNGYSREVEMVPGHERATRLYRQFRHLHAGLTVIGTPRFEIWRLLPQVALDGLTPGRKSVLEYLMAEPTEHSTGSVAGHCRLPETTVRRHLEDLNAHGAVDATGTHPERWAASAWLRDQWWAVMGTEDGPM
jgi:hypothetical protein